MAYSVSKAAGESVELFLEVWLTSSARTPSNEMPGKDAGI